MTTQSKSYQKDYLEQNINGKKYDKFGAEYFVLPNPEYGSWQKNKFK